jgi:hypothetical protein
MGREEERSEQRLTLWQHFMHEHGEPTDRHPTSVFDQAACDRLFSASDRWGRRQLAWPALAAFGLLATGMGWFSWANYTGYMYPLFWSAIALLLFFGAHQVWFDYHNITMRALLRHSTTAQGRRWLERFEAHHLKLLDRPTTDFALIDSVGTEADVPCEKLAKLLQGQGGRLRVIGSGYSSEDRLQLGVPGERLFVRVRDEVVQREPKDPEVSGEIEHREKSLERDCVMVLKGVKQKDFAIWRDDLVNKAKGRTQARLEGVLNAMFDTANDSDRILTGNVIEQILNRHSAGGPRYSRESIDKILHGTESSEEYAYILPYLIARKNGVPVNIEMAERGHPKVHIGPDQLTP